jgi:hypothetical protein
MVFVNKKYELMDPVEVGLLCFANALGQQKVAFRFWLLVIFEVGMHLVWCNE